MGKLKFILLCCLIFLATSCEKLFNTDNVGQPIQFGATLSSSTPKTRTSYSGVVDHNTDGNTERIYWTQDDPVSIYMDWDKTRDGNGYTGNPEYGIYSVTPGSDLHPKDGNQRYGRISYVSGKVLKWQGAFDGGDGRAHEYPHTFYSAYPANTTFADGKFTFDLPSDQSSQEGIDMRYAYMAAYEKDVMSNEVDEGHVDLHYYPMITTLYVTLVNDTSSPITPGDIIIKSTGKPICGAYTVEIDDTKNKFVFDKALDNDNKTVTINVNKPLQPNKVGKTDIAFFIIPQEYDPSTLSLVINGREHNFGQSYQSSLKEAYKYNITVNLSGSTPPTFKETIGPGEAQFLILWITNYLKDGAFNDFFGFDQNGDHRYGAFNDKFINGGGWDSETIAEDFVNFFTEEQLNKFYQKLLSETSFITSNKQITHPIHADFFNLFPQLETVKIQTYSTVEISNHKNLKTATFQYAEQVKITGCKSLTTVTLENSYNLTSLEIDDCEALTTITGYDMHKLTELKLINTPYFKKGEFTNVGQIVAVTLNNCSTGLDDGDNATLNLGGKYTIKERTNSSNVTVQ